MNLRLVWWREGGSNLLCFLRRNQTKPSSFHIKIRRLSACLLSLIFSFTILNFSYLTYTVYKKPFRLRFSEDLCQVSRWRLAAAPPLAGPGPWYWATRRPASCPLTASSPRYLSRVMWLSCVTCNMSRVTCHAGALGPTRGQSPAHLRRGGLLPARCHARLQRQGRGSGSQDYLGSAE